MRLEASFSAVGVLLLLTFADSELAKLFAPTPDPAPQQTVDAASCRSQASLVEKSRHYEFFGSRAADAGSSLRQRLLVTSDYQGRESRFTGQTDWHIEWRACFEQSAGKCTVRGVLSTVHVTYTLPRWADRENAPAQLRDRWDRYKLSLTAHEKGHGAIALEVAKLIDMALVGKSSDESCEALNAESIKIVDEVMQRGEAMQREYDRATRHGSAQGAQFPF